MDLTLAQIASRVLRNCQIPEDASTAGVQALADAKVYVNERARDVWRRRCWREYDILGSFSVPANTQIIALASIVKDSGTPAAGNGFLPTFYEVVSIRNGSTPIPPEDSGAISSIQADAWANTGTPLRHSNRGQNGIFLLGQYSVATTLNFYGKAAWQDLLDSETWLLGNPQCLIEAATGDMIRDNDRDDARAAIRYQAFAAEVQKLIDAAEVQGSGIKRIIPVQPWTDLQNRNQLDTSLTGYNPIY